MEIKHQQLSTPHNSSSDLMPPNSVWSQNKPKIKKIFQMHACDNKVSLQELVKFCKRCLLVPELISTPEIKQLYTKYTTNHKLAFKSETFPILNLKQFEDILQLIALHSIEGNKDLNNKLNEFFVYIKEPIKSLYKQNLITMQSSDSEEDSLNYSARHTYQSKIYEPLQDKAHKRHKNESVIDLALKVLSMSSNTPDTMIITNTDSYLIPTPRLSFYPINKNTSQSSSSNEEHIPDNKTNSSESVNRRTSGGNINDSNDSLEENRNNADDIEELKEFVAIEKKLKAPEEQLNHNKNIKTLVPSKQVDIQELVEKKRNVKRNSKSARRSIVSNSPKPNLNSSRLKKENTELNSSKKINERTNSAAVIPKSTRTTKGKPPKGKSKLKPEETNNTINLKNLKAESYVDKDQVEVIENLVKDLVYDSSDKISFRIDKSKVTDKDYKKPWIDKSNVCSNIKSSIESVSDKSKEGDIENMIVFYKKRVFSNTFLRRIIFVQWYNHTLNKSSKVQIFIAKSNHKIKLHYFFALKRLTHQSKDNKKKGIGILHTFIKKRVRNNLLIITKYNNKEKAIKMALLATVILTTSKSSLNRTKKYILQRLTTKHYKEEYVKLLNALNKLKSVIQNWPQIVKLPFP